MNERGNQVSTFSRNFNNLALRFEAKG